MRQLIARFRSFCVSSFPVVAFALVVANFVTCCCVSRSCHPQYLYKTVVTTNYLHSVVTNFLYSPSLSPSTIATNTPSRRDIEPTRYPVNYRYFVLGSKPTIYMHGVYYSEGDICSRGIILRIFPDCVYLLNGSILENKYQPKDDEYNFRKSPESYKLTNKERPYDR